MAQQKNISSVLTQELLAAGDNVKVNSITMTNTHTSSSCYVSLYIAKKLIGKFYLLKGNYSPLALILYSITIF